MNVRRLTGPIALASLAAIMGACSAEAPTQGTNPGVDIVQSDLQLGATGEEVRAVNDYLTKYGYFPNEELAHSYPWWRPLITEPPAQADVFDEHTAEGVRQLQARTALPVTGIVDAATRDLLKAPRCGVPEGRAELDTADKFAQWNSKWSKTALTWKFTNSTNSAYRAAAAASFASWAAQTTLTFREETTTATADIQLTFGAIDGVSNILAQTASPSGGGDMTIDNAETWSTANPTPAGAVDMQAVLTHEIGHALGLQHSSVGSATMLPNYFFNMRSLELDDKIGISSLYDTFGTLTGKAKDIAVGANGAIWIIGTDAFGDGFRVYKWNGSGWTPSDGGAVRVAVGPTGIPWVVTASGAIFRRTTTDPTVANAWQQLPGLANDIGVGANGDAWVIGADPFGDGYRVHKWNGSTWIPTDGGATKITVGPNGIPWLLTATGVFYRRTTADPSPTGAWEQLAGTSTDLAINAGNYLWSVGAVSSGQENMSVWDEQSALGSAPAVKAWVQGKRMGVGGANCAVAVGPNGRPFMVDNAGTIWTSIDGAP